VVNILHVLSSLAVRKWEADADQAALLTGALCARMTECRPLTLGSHMRTVLSVAEERREEPSGE
jgi:hypothetical protein